MCIRALDDSNKIVLLKATWYVQNSIWHMTVTSKNCMNEEIKERLITRNASNISVPFHLLTWNLKIKTYKAIIVSNGCQALSLTLREEH